MVSLSNHGALHYPGVLLPGTYAVPGSGGDGRLYIEDGKETKVFPALEWLAAMCSHIPNKGEQMVRYYASRRSPFMTIISMGTLNTPGTITYIEA
jgi:hypothetical protein